MMLDNAERFTHGNSLLHRADARAKVGPAALLAVVLALLQGFPAALAGLGLGLTLAALARLPLGPLLKRLVAVNAFVAFLWLVVPVTYGGAALFQLGPLAVSAGGVRICALVTLKTNAIMLCFLALVATSPLPQTGRALRSLGLPDKLCWLLLFAYRYLFVIAEEYTRMSRAARMRGFVPRTNRHTWRTVAYQVAMTLVRGVERSRRVGRAMALRGFTGTLHVLDAPSPGPRDMALGAVLVLAATALVVMEFASHGVLW